jgi:hypothetical protein
MRVGVVRVFDKDRVFCVVDSDTLSLTYNKVYFAQGK